MNGIRNRFKPKKPSFSYDTSGFGPEETVYPDVPNKLQLRQELLNNDEWWSFEDDLNRAVLEQDRLQALASGDGEFNLADDELDTDNVLSKDWKYPEGPPEYADDPLRDPTWEEGLEDVDLEARGAGEAVGEGVAEAAAVDIAEVGGSLISGAVVAGAAVANEWSGRNAQRSTNEKIGRSAMDTAGIGIASGIGFALGGPVGSAIGGALASMVVGGLYDLLSGDYSKKRAQDKLTIQWAKDVVARCKVAFGEDRVKFGKIKQAILDSHFSKWSDANFSRLPPGLPNMTVNSMREPPRSQYADVNANDIEYQVSNARWWIENIRISEGDSKAVLLVGLEIDDAITRLVRVAKFSNAPVNPKSGQIRWDLGTHDTLEKSRDSYNARFKPPSKFAPDLPDLMLQLRQEIVAFGWWEIEAWSNATTDNDIVDDGGKAGSSGSSSTRKPTHKPTDDTAGGASNMPGSNDSDDSDADSDGDGMTDANEVNSWLESNAQASVDNQDGDITFFNYLKSHSKNNSGALLEAESLYNYHMSIGKGDGFSW